MDNGKIARRDILQAASTVLAGALIFLTLDATLGLNLVGIFFMIAIYILIISIGFAVSPDANFAKKTLDSNRGLKLSGVMFVIGLGILFGAISLAIFKL